MSATLSALAEPVFCDVVRVYYVRGPDGGLIMITDLACGMHLWRKVKRELRRPRSKAPCMACYLRRLAPPELGACPCCQVRPIAPARAQAGIGAGLCRGCATFIEALVELRAGGAA